MISEKFLNYCYLIENLIVNKTIELEQSNWSKCSGWYIPKYHLLLKFGYSHHFHLLRFIIRYSSKVIKQDIDIFKDIITILKKYKFDSSNDDYNETPIKDLYNKEHWLKWNINIDPINENSKICSINASVNTDSNTVYDLISYLMEKIPRKFNVFLIIRGTVNIVLTYEETLKLTPVKLEEKLSE